MRPRSTLSRATAQRGQTIQPSASIPGTGMGGPAAPVRQRRGGSGQVCICRHSSLSVAAHRAPLVDRVRPSHPDLPCRLAHHPRLSPGAARTNSKFLLHSTLLGGTVSATFRARGVGRCCNTSSTSPRRVSTATGRSSSPSPRRERYGRAWLTRSAARRTTRAARPRRPDGSS